MNVYTEEYRPGDFLLHMAGKLYEASTPGAIALIRQFDTLSLADDVKDIEAFFATPYVLNAFSGTCVLGDGPGECLPEDRRRLKLPEPMAAMSFPNRYRHVGERYYWLTNWTDVYDVPGWNDGRVAPTNVIDPSPEAPSEETGEHDEL